MTGQGWRVRILVLAGGALGTIARHLVTEPLNGSSWPWGTFLVNVTGSGLLGLLVGRCGRSDARSAWAIPLVGVGVLGAFTTFGTFVAEIWAHPRVAVLYATASVAVGLGAAVIGRNVGER